MMHPSREFTGRFWFCPETLGLPLVLGALLLLLACAAPEQPKPDEPTPPAIHAIGFSGYVLQNESGVELHYSLPPAESQESRGVWLEIASGQIRAAPTREFGTVSLDPSAALTLHVDGRTETVIASDLLRLNCCRLPDAPVIPVPVGWPTPYVTERQECLGQCTDELNHTRFDPNNPNSGACGEFIQCVQECPAPPFFVGYPSTDVDTVDRVDALRALESLGGLVCRRYQEDLRAQPSGSSRRVGRLRISRLP